MNKTENTATKATTGQPPNGTLGFRTVGKCVESPARQRGLVRDDTVNAKIEQVLHVFRDVDCPGVNLEAAMVRPQDEAVVDSFLLYAEEIDFEP